MLLRIQLSAILLLLASAAISVAAPPGDRFTCNDTHRRPVFAAVEAFEKALQARTAPWGELLAPPPADDGGESAEPGGPYSRGLKTIQSSGSMAIVFAHAKPLRTSPFCGVMFLLVKKGDGFHVADFIRRTAAPGYSNMSDPEILDLEPGNLLHLHFTEYMGGRRWGFDTDEFYTVKNNRFQRTLELANDGCYLDPADPYGEFSQETTLTVSGGKLHAETERCWAFKDGSERTQRLAAQFQWEPRSGTFVSKDAKAITIKEPETWTGNTLPKPPARMFAAQDQDFATDDD